MKFLLLLLAAIFPSLALSGINSDTGFYLKGSIGMGSYTPSEKVAFNDWFIPLTIFPQASMGFRINDYTAIETSYDYLKNSEYKGGGITSDILGFQQKWGPDHYKLYALELTARAIYPFRSGISFFAKGGIAAVYQDVFNQTYEGSPPTIDSQETQILPAIGGGISFNFTQHFALDTAFTYLPGNKTIGDIKMATIGLAYTF